MKRKTLKDVTRWLIDFDDPTQTDPKAIALSPRVEAIEYAYPDADLSAVITSARVEKYKRDPAFRQAVDARRAAEEKVPIDQDRSIAFE